MIVNLKGIHFTQKLLSKLSILDNLFKFFGHHKNSHRLKTDLTNLKREFYTHYPEFVKDNSGNSLCVSCGVCEEICPTHVIKIEKANLVNYPDSLVTGEVPLHFNIDFDNCIRCGLCSDSCVPGAIALKAEYVGGRVDLVKGLAE